MNPKGSRTEKQDSIRGHIAQAFAGKTSISKKRFLEIFYDSRKPPSIGRFESQFMPDAATLDEIFADLAKSTKLAVAVIKSKYSARESFAQFGTLLLRAGAYPEVEE